MSLSPLHMVTRYVQAARRKCYFLTPSMVHTFTQNQNYESLDLQYNQISEPLKRAYESAVNMYNFRDWNGTSVLVRRLLEGITKSQLEKKKKHHKLKIYEQIEKLSDPALIDQSHSEQILYIFPPSEQK